MLFLYKQVLKQELPWLGEVVRAKKPARLPVVLSIDEVQRILAQLEGEVGLVARLLYGGWNASDGGGRLRVKDVDFGRNEIIIRDGKAQKDRVTVPPATLVAPLKQHLARVRSIHQQELAEGRGDV